MALSTTAPSAYQAVGLAVEHQNLTHRSENNVSALHILVPMLHDLLSGSDPAKVLSRYAGFVRIPRVTGEELSRLYREHHGPGNIPKDRMWELHTDLRQEPFDLEDLVSSHDVDQVVNGLFATACYPEHGLPLLMYFARRHIRNGSMDLEGALLANANAGGDNVHRGMVLGLVAGAAADEIPEHLKRGLTDVEDLQEEIEAFSAFHK
jgi:hypothetical protein